MGCARVRGRDGHRRRRRSCGADAAAIRACALLEHPLGNLSGPGDGRHCRATGELTVVDTARHVRARHDSKGGGEDNDGLGEEHGRYWRRDRGL